MTLIALVLYIALIGLVVWAITTLIPMPDTFRTLIYIIATVAVILWLLNLLGVGLPPLQLHHIR